MSERWNNWSLEVPPTEGAFLTDRGWEIPLKGTDPAKGLTELIVAFSQANASVAAGAANIVLITMNTGVFDAGDKLILTVNYNEQVDVDTTGGTPSIPITVGATARSAAYVSGTGTNKLVFEYTVQATEEDLDGVALTGTQIALNSGTITDADGENSSSVTYTTLVPLTFSGSLVDTNNRTIEDVVYGTGNFDTDDTFEIAIEYNSPVTVTGEPRIPLFENDGTTPLAGEFATFKEVDGLNVVFEYTVLENDDAATGIQVGADIDLNGGTIVASPNAEKDVELEFAQEATTITLNQA